MKEELTSAARKSDQLAENISDVMELARNTPSEYWLESNLVRLIGDFIELFHHYVELRKGFIESLTDPRSPLLRMIGGDGNTKEFSERKRVNTIMSYHRLGLLKKLAR